MKQAQVLFGWLLWVGLLSGLVPPALADEIWITPAAKDADETVGNWGVTRDGESRFSFALPDDFVTFVAAKVVVIKKKDKEITYDLDLSIAQNLTRHDDFALSLFDVPTDLGECGKCKGGVTSLTLRYTGAEAAQIEVRDKKGEVVFNQEVEPWGVFTFTGTDKDNKLGREIEVIVNGESVTEITISCHKPMGVGLVAGDFEVIDGQSKDGGTLCHLPADEDQLLEIDISLIFEDIVFFPGADYVSLDFRSDPKKESQVVGLRFQFESLTLGPAGPPGP